MYFTCFYKPTKVLAGERRRSSLKYTLRRKSIVAGSPQIDEADEESGGVELKEIKK